MVTLARTAQKLHNDHIDQQQKKQHNIITLTYTDIRKTCNTVSGHKSRKVTFAERQAQTETIHGARLPAYPVRQAKLINHLLVSRGALLKASIFWRTRGHTPNAAARPVDEIVPPGPAAAPAAIYCHVGTGKEMRSRERPSLLLL